ncbi:hypothetical protein ACIQWL_37440 [Streptomyces mirabilis]|uniref:hypothetical protein n=1 Tax=Streptomyces mirabilis TaxID=68239 RepID=UPI003824B5A3
MRDPLKKSPSHVAAELDIYVKELNEYVFGLAPVVVKGGGKQSATARPELRLVKG